MIMVHGWIKLFGFSALALRILPLIFSSLTLIFIYKSVFKLVGVYAAFISSFLFLFSSLHFYYAIEVRTYSLVSLFTAIIYYLYIVLIQDEKNKWVIYCIVLANIGIVMSNYFGWLVIANQGFILMFYFKNKELRKKIITIILSTLIISSPLLFLMIKQFLVSSKGTWIAPPTEEAYHLFIEFFFNGREAFNYIVYVFSASIIAFLIYLFKTKKIISGNFKEAFLLLICFAFPYTFMFLISFKIPMFIDRYILFNSIPLYLFTGIAIGKLLSSSKYLQLAALIAISIPVYVYMFINSKTFNYREVKNAVDKCIKYKDDQTIIFIHPAWNVTEFAYYYNLKYFNDIKSDQIKILEPENIYGVYSFDQATEILEKSKDQFQTVIYFTDGTNFENPFNKIPLDTSRNFIRLDSVFYPQCIRVMMYKKIAK